MPDGYDFVQNDDGTLLRITCKDRKAAVIDLTGGTVQLRWRDAGGTLVTPAMTIEDATNGIASYQWAVGELDADKMHFGFKITDATGKTISSNKLLTLTGRNPLS